MQKTLLTPVLLGVLSGALRWRGVALAAIFFGLSHVQLAGASTVFDVTEIGTNLNAVSSPFYVINNRGEATGGREFFIGSVKHARLLIYLPAAAYGLPAGLSEIEFPAPVGDGAYFVGPRGFNAHGRIVGAWRLQSNTLLDRGFIWDQGQFTDLGEYRGGVGVNDDGWIALQDSEVRQGEVIVGITDTPFGPTHQGLDNVASSAVAINNLGQVLLHARHNFRASQSDPEVSDFRIFLWQQGAIQTIPGIGGPPSVGAGSQTFASDINNRGEAVGRDLSGVWLYLPQAAYGLNAGINMIDPQFRFGQRVNDLGVVLLDGNSTLYWETGRVFNAQNKLPAGSPWRIYGLNDLNNPGQFLARGYLGTEATLRNVILTPRTARVITVNDAADKEDADPDDGVIDTDLDKEGLQVTLRAAINHANSTNRPGADTIEFDLDSSGPVVISPTNALPDISDPLTIDGMSQPGSGRVGIRGLAAGPADGLRLVTSNCVIRGLAISQFQRAGILIRGGLAHTIIGNILGTDTNGTPGLGNGIGLLIQNSFSNIVGGLIAPERNVVSANLTDGICITNSSEIDIRANFVGTTPDGNLSLPNGQAGLVAHKVTGLAIGTPGLSSVINSATAAIMRDVDFGSMVNCLVGLNANGSASLGGTINGLLIENSGGINIGGLVRNVFGGISSTGIKVLDSTNIQVAANYIGTDRTGNTNLPVGTGIVAERSRGLGLGSGALSVICATNGAVFRQLSGLGTNFSKVINCNFGIGANGNSKVGDMINGLFCEVSDGLNIGGSSRNVFGGISSNAITLVETTNTQVLGNYIGTDRNGNASIPVNFGIVARNARDILIGASNSLSVICATNGALLSQLKGFSNAVNNCFFGLGAGGASKVGNMVNGLVSEQAENLNIGGVSRNVFGGISSNAIALMETTNTQVLGNYIGTDRNGSASVPVAIGIFAKNARDLIIGASNTLSVICATNGALLSELSGLSNRLNNCLFGLGTNGTTKVGNMLNGLVAVRSSGLNLGGIARNVFAGISSNAITLQAMTNIQLVANFIGTDRTGNASVPVGTGIFAEQVRDLAIGASHALSVISATNGALLRELSGVSNMLNNCYFGLAANGTNKVGNMRNGLTAERFSGLNLGGIARNVFAHISSNAVTFQAMTNVQVLLNSIGTDVTGVNRAPIGGNGITAIATRGLTVGNGGAGAAAGVIVGSCSRHGIEAVDSPELRVVNSLLGANPAGTGSLSNNLSGVKVHVSTSFATTALSADTLVAGNTIAFNGGAGVELTQDGGVSAHEAVHVVQGNRVQNNAGDGIRVGTNVSSVLIGGTNLAGANDIRRNGGSGVLMTSVGSQIFVEINSTVSNSVKGIQRAFDVLPPMLQQITSAIKGSTHVQGNVGGQPNQTVRLHFYGHRPKAGAQGEGEMWLGTVNVPLNAAGVGSYNSVLPRTSPAGWLVASTAADPFYGTSEFSTSRAVQLSPDTDGDGMPDAWEALYPSCLNPLVPDANGDCDHDGFTNLQEYIAHTDPTRADSSLRVENLVTTGDGVTLKFTGVAGRQYGLERRTDLTTGSWVRVTAAIPEADGQVTLSDPDEQSGNAYYRIVAEFP